MDASLPLYQRMAVWMHLLMCRYCVRFRRQLIILRKMSWHVDSDPPDTDTAVRLTTEAKERMRQAIGSLS